MKVLDRYIIVRYLSTLFFALLIFTLISVAIDFSDKVQAFIEKPCTLSQILFKYFPGFILHMAGLLLPLYTLIGVIFFTSRLAFNAEILSMLNAGMSFRRLMRPYLIAGGMVALFHLSLNHFLVPWTNKSRLWFERTFVWTDQEKGKNNDVHFLIGDDVKVYVQRFDKGNKSASNLRLEKFSGSKVVSILEAKTALWKGEPNHWEIKDYTVRDFDGLNERYRHFTAPLDTAINLTPEDFVWYHNQNEEMTTPELNAAIARDRSRGLATSKNYEIEKQRRTADAFTILILTVIGLAMAGRKVRGGMGLHLAVGIGIGAMFILLSKFAVSFASSGSVPVALGMWIPNLIFMAVALWLTSQAQK